MGQDDAVLRCATWLAPGLPLGLFELVSSKVAQALSTEATVESFTATSGPDPDDDPFARDEFDLGFMCAPAYQQLAARTPTSVRLVQAAAVFIDERNLGKPVYFAELVVRADVEASSLRDLAGARIGYNDRRSLSGLLALEQQFEQGSLDKSSVSMVHTGGHRQSIAMLESGRLDAASIDSNTLLAMGGVPEGLRVLETWGPFPVQPIVVRSSLLDTTRDIITTTVLALNHDPETARALRRFRVERFAPVSEADYR